MSKKSKKTEKIEKIEKKEKTQASENVPAPPQLEYKETLNKLQFELVKLQRHYIESNDKILIIFEGRKASGKDGTIKRIEKYLNH